MAVIHPVSDAGCLLSINWRAAGLVGHGEPRSRLRPRRSLEPSARAGVAGGTLTASHWNPTPAASGAFLGQRSMPSALLRGGRGPPGSHLAWRYLSLGLMAVAC